MKIGDRIRVREPSKDTLPTVAALAGQTGEIVAKNKYIGAPLLVRLDDGSLWHCWPNEVAIAH